MEDNVIRTAAEMREVRIAEKVSGEERGGMARWWICRTTGIDTAAEDMWDGNK